MSSSGPASPPVTERTFQYDEDLPSIPVPDLDRTLHKYLESVTPFVTEEEFANTQRIIAKFSRGIGQKLHRKLVEISKTERNWTERFWEQYQYMSSRGPIAVSRNIFGPFFAVKDVWPPWDGTQIERTSLCLTLGLRYFQAARKETLPVMKIASGEVFDMSQVRSLFCSSRIPGEPMDRIAKYFKTEREGPCPDHVIVTCNGHIFKMGNLFEDNGEVVGSSELSRRLSLIKEKCESPGQGIGILTADDRTSWAKIYEHMCSLDPTNSRHFETIRSSVMVIVLDPEKPANVSEIMYQCMAGPHGEDRWFDKCNNTIFFENGTSGTNADHAQMDGMVNCIYSYWVHTKLRALEENTLGDNLNPIRSDPEEIVFVTDRRVEEAKQHAADTYKRLASNVEVICSEFGGYGKKFVKSVGFHPDAFFQLAIQLTYYRMYGRCVPCYEAATTRQYYHGRTETVRSTTQEALDWCVAMTGDSHTRTEQRRLLEEAHNKHMELMYEAMKGKGIDRYLLALFVLALESGEDMPAIFTDPSFHKSGNFRLSTSLVGYVPVQGATAAVCHDGYGCFYNIEDNTYRAVVTCFKNCPTTDAMRFFENLTQSLTRMRKVITQAKL